MTEEPLSSPGEGTGSSAPETPYVPKYEKRRNRWLLVTVVDYTVTRRLNLGL